VRCTAYLPDIGGVLPVYADPYDHFDATLFHELTDEQLSRYLDANVAAVREVADRAQPDVALANHLVAGPVILAPAIGGRGASARSPGASEAAERRAGAGRRGPRTRSARSIPGATGSWPMWAS